VCVGGLLLALVSWIDDVRPLSPLIRLGPQLAAIAIGLLALTPSSTLLNHGLAPLLGVAVAALLWLWFVNLFNFMDGMDGLAGSEAVTIAMGLMLFAGLGIGHDPGMVALAAVVAAAAFGFLAWNWAPARIFLGDVGSVPLGYLLGFLLLDATGRGFWKIALILPLYFLADATITLTQRLLRGERVWLAHRQHFYQRAVGRGLSHRDVMRRVVAADVALVGCGWLAENGAGILALAAALTVVGGLLASLADPRSAAGPAIEEAEHE